MTRIMSCALIAALTSLMASAAPARAQLARTFVSAAGGNDANDCSRAAPCRTFQGAHDRTIDAGEIIVLNAGHYGPVLITKSISILNDSAGEASISVGGGVVAIIINARRPAQFICAASPSWVTSSAAAAGSDSTPVSR